MGMFRLLIALLVAVHHARMEEIHVTMLGEPKSGTTWFGVLFRDLAKTLCTEARRCVFAEDAAAMRRAHKGDVELALTFPRRSVTFTTKSKHVVPCLPSGDDACRNHVNNIVHVKPPCGLNASRGAVGAAEVDACVAACAAGGAARGFRQPATILAHVHRDPRDAAISGCYHLRQQGTLEACVRDMYPTTALWTRFRDRWFGDAACCGGGTRCDDSRVLDLSYAALSKCPRESLRAMARVLGFDAADDELNRTAAPHREWTRRREHDGASSYRDYNLSRATVDWMDDLHGRLEFSPAYRDAPCRDIPWPPEPGPP